MWLVMLQAKCPRRVRAELVVAETGVRHTGTHWAHKEPWPGKGSQPGPAWTEAVRWQL